MTKRAKGYTVRIEGSKEYLIVAKNEGHLKRILKKFFNGVKYSTPYELFSNVKQRSGQVVSMRYVWATSYEV